eukprot:UN11648
MITSHINNLSEDFLNEFLTNDWQDSPATENNIVNTKIWTNAKTKTQSVRNNSDEAFRYSGQCMDGCREPIKFHIKKIRGLGVVLYVIVETVKNMVGQIRWFG